MGHELPMVAARELVAVLEQLGCHYRSLSGTGHRRYVHPNGRRTTVPFHTGQDIGRGLLRKVLKDIKLTPEQFKELLWFSRAQEHPAQRALGGKCRLLTLCGTPPFDLCRPILHTSLSLIT